MGGELPQRAFERLFKKLQGDDASGVTANPVAWFDSLLSQVNQIVPVAIRTVMDNTGVTFALQKATALSEINRQLFLQFLLSERTYLSGHHIMTGMDLYRKFSLDVQICQKKQAQITNSLNRIFNVEGISADFYSALTTEQSQTLIAAMAFAENVTRQQFTMMTNLDDFLNNRETGAVRRVLEQAFEHHADTDNEFDARNAWVDMAKRWNAWASKYNERVAAFKELWNTMGGGKDLNSNPQALKVIDDYYQDLYQQIDAGNMLALMDQANQRMFESK
jgi:hypothetical protein